MSSAAPTPTAARQDEIQAWFDETYTTRGLSYLRPEEAYEVFPTLLEARPGEHLLDIACGPGQLLKVAVTKGLVATGIDLSPAAIALCQKRVPTAEATVANAEALPFADNTFDLVTCLGSLERMLDRPRVLGEVKRVLRPGGRACFLVRNADHPLWRFTRSLRLQNRRGHQDAAEQQNWTTLFRDAGFTVRDLYPDQWPMMRGRWQLRRFGVPARFDRPKHGFGPVSWAYEFIFLLSHAED